MITRRILSPVRARPHLAFLIALALPLSGCGAGTAAAISGGGDTGGSGNAPASLSNLTVLHPKEPRESRLRFVLTDVEGDRAEVAFYVQLPGGGREPLTQIGANPAMFASSDEGLEHEIAWNFAAEPALPDDAHFTPGVRVIASVQNGSQEIVLGANDDFGLGNDPPQVHDPAPPAPEVDGVVPLRFSLSDSSDDLVSIRVAFDVVGDEPDAGWRLARPGGLLQGEPTPEYAFTGVDSGSGDVEVFFWDTDFDLKDLERDVRVRFLPEDEAAAGDTTATPIFRVDNNAEPIASISDGLLLLNPDQRGGIPIPYTVRDEESDEVQLVFQWKRPDEEFPDLPDTPAEINSVLKDPIKCQNLQICSEYATWVEGRVVPIDENTVRLPELATSAGSLQAHGVVGREVEIMRASKRVESITGSWESNPLRSPIAALPFGDGLSALVVDSPNSGSWRVIEIELATGHVIRDLATGSGTPSVAAWERGERSILIASSASFRWRVDRVDFASGSVTPLIAQADTDHGGRLRGIASLCANSALITVGDKLVRLDWTGFVAPRAVTLIDGLATPWGVVLDRSREGCAFVAERDHSPVDDALAPRGRVLSVNIKTRAIEPLSIPGLSSPRDLGLARNGSRLVVISDVDSSSGQAELRAVELGAGAFDESHLLSNRLDGSARAVIPGENDLVLIVHTNANEILAGGGIVQRRTIASFDAAQQVARVSADFAPPLRPTQCFRIGEPTLVRHGSAAGVRGVFVWDSDDVPERGQVQFRAIPMDAELGLVGTTKAAREIRSPFDTTPFELGGVGITDDPQAVTAADIDGDGDVDLASAYGNALAIFFQIEGGIFNSTPLTLGGPGVTNAPRSVTAADIDNDGDLDLVSANAGGNTLTIFIQTSAGAFSTTPLMLGGVGVTTSPFQVVAADIDGDGDLDLVSANAGGNTLTVFLQTSRGDFGSPPITIGGPGVTHFPRSVAAADLDGDGDLDLASANSLGSNTLTVFFQSSPGVFSSTPLVLGGPGVTSLPCSITAADFDDDGDLDLAAANLLSAKLIIFFQTSPGVFGSTPLFLGGAGVMGTPWSVTAADLDGDGDLDLAPASSPPTIFLQTRPGSFSSTPVSLSGAGVVNARSVTAADLDGDGDCDLAFANAGSNALSVLIQTSPGTFGAAPRTFGGRAVGVTAADLDGDGDLDLASANQGLHRLDVFFQIGPGVFSSTPLALGDITVTGFPTSITAADLDEDGDLDLVSTNGWTHTLTVFFQTGPGAFDLPPLSLGGPGVTDLPQSVTVADLDCDGDIDLASANESNDTITVFFQSAPGTFSSTPLVLGDSGVTVSPRSITAADIDGDGDFDLASANVLSQTLTVFYQSSPGVFGSTPLSLGGPAVTGGPVAVAAADVDGDGNIDLTSANNGNDTLSVFFQTRPGVFGSKPLILGGPGVTDGPQSVSVADIDRDGDLDLASANKDGHDLTVFFQISPKEFSSRPLELGNLAITPTPFCIAAADIDGDGDPDLALGNDSTLRVFWNNH